MMLLSLFIFLILAAVILLVIGIEEAITGENYFIKGRLARYTSRQKVDSGTAESGHRMSFGRNLLRSGSRIFAALKLSANVEDKLVQADLLLRGEEFVFLNLMLALGTPLFLWFLTYNTGLSILGGLFLLLFPWFFLEHLRQKRLHAINNQLADALVVMTNCLRAGYSFLQAMEMVTKEMSPPLAGEFGRALREIQMGTTAEGALGHLSQRVGSEDLDLVLTAILIQRQIGGNLAEILDNIAETIRERVRIKGEIKTLTAQGRISGLIVGLLPVILLLILFLINPAYIGTLFTEPLGLALLGGAAFGEVLGVFLVRRIVDIRV